MRTPPALEMWVWRGRFKDPSSPEDVGLGLGFKDPFSSGDVCLGGGGGGEAERDVIDGRTVMMDRGRMVMDRWTGTDGLSDGRADRQQGWKGEQGWDRWEAAQ